MLTFGSLFAGIGGFDLGLERAGMCVKWQCEIDPYCQKVLAKHWPNVRRYEDVRDCGGANLEPVDLICGGFPCQDASLAGKRLGLEGERTTLWFEYARIIRELRPRWVLAENVPGLLSVDSGRFFGRILRDLAESGYRVEWDCVPASAVGANHRRDRVWIVGHSETRNVADAQGAGRGAWSVETNGSDAEKSKEREGEPTRSCTGGAEICDASSERFPLGIFGPLGGGQKGVSVMQPERSDWWAVEPNVGRLAHGVSRRVDRLRALGNAVVPQVVEWIGKRIVEADNADNHHHIT